MKIWAGSALLRVMVRSFQIAYLPAVFMYGGEQILIQIAEFVLVQYIEVARTNATIRFYDILNLTKTSLFTRLRLISQ